jgi:hypothetical protein
MKQMKKQIFLLMATVLTLLAGCRKNVADVRDFGKIKIDSISPGSGPSGMHIIVYGNNFSYEQSEVKARINNLDAQVIQISPSRMMLYIPEGAVSGKLHFTFDRRNPTNDQFDYSGQLDTVAVGPELIIDESLIPAIIIEQITPLEGKAGDVITIKGFNFSAGNCKLFFGTEEAIITEITTTQVKVKVPRTTPGTVSLIIQQGTHTVTAGSFTIQETPAGVKEIYWVGSDGITGAVSKAVIDEFGNANIQELYGADDGLTNTSLGVKSDVANGFIYWIDNNTIHRGTTDGAGPATLIYSDPGPIIADMDIDKNGKVYFTSWSSTMAGHHSIKRINGDGTGEVEELYQLAGEPMAHGLKLHIATGKIYWTEMLSLSVFEGSIDGQTVQPAKLLFDGSDGLASPANIALDPAENTIYIMDNGNGAIYKGALDGSGSLQKLAVPYADLAGASDIEIDPVNHFLYWHLWDYTNGAVMRCKTDGTGVQRVVNNVRYGAFLDLVL